MTRRARVAVLHAPGTNRDREAALACELAGGQAHVVYVSDLVAGAAHLKDYQMLVLPGGFSYGDDLGAGSVWALELRYRLNEALAAFHEAGKPILGICNGFQVLVKAGLLPGAPAGAGMPAWGGNAPQTATLAGNRSARFECCWVYLRSRPASRCIFTQDLDDLIYCPVAHGEGRFVAGAAGLPDLQAQGLVALTYVDAAGREAGGAYPANPNGSEGDIAGICDMTGTVLGLMPHPEDHVFAAQHPSAARGRAGMRGLPLFQNGIRFAAALS